MTRAIWSTYSRPELLKIIRDSNLKGYDKMKRNELLDLMEKHAHRFSHVKAKEGRKKGAHAPKVPGAPKKGPYKPTGKPRGRPKKAPSTPKTPAMRSRPTLVAPPTSASPKWEPQTPLLVHRWQPQTPSIPYSRRLTASVHHLQLRSKV